MRKIGFIGAGQMAQALGAGIAKSGPTSNQEIEFVIFDPNDQATTDFATKVAPAPTTVAAGNAEILKQCGIVFLAVKPQYLANALKGTASPSAEPTSAEPTSAEPTSAVPGPNQPASDKPLIISVLAGVPIARIASLLNNQRIIRVMPNTPCLIGYGASGMATSPTVTQADAETVKGFLSAISTVVEVSEPMLDSVTGLSGSGPAFVFRFMEAMIQGAVSTGMSPETAKQLTLQTVQGAAALAKSSEDKIEVLRDRVTSPGGTTLAGLNSMEATGFFDSVVSAIVSATERSKELGKL